MKPSMIQLHLKNIKYCLLVCLLTSVLWANSPLLAQERVYVSTDKECYLAGESIWCAVYCLDESVGRPGTYSTLSSVAYLEFHNSDGLAAVIKIALMNGRGGGRLEIPFSFPTGNYSIVAYTRQDGGDSQGTYRGKIVTILNTLTNERVKDGVEITTIDKSISAENTFTRKEGRELSIEITKPMADNIFPIRIKNTGRKKMALNISVYHVDSITRMIGKNGYNTTNLLDRRGNFAPTGELEYEGEIIHGKIVTNGRGKENNIARKSVYISAMGGKDDIYICQSDSLGHLTYYTGNIYGQRDLVFDVVNGGNYTKVDYGADTTLSYSVELVNKPYSHKTENIPLLKISPALARALSERSIKMQIARRFTTDTLFDLLKFRNTPLLNGVKPHIYNLDEYTRFPLIEEVVREFMPELRIRKFEGNTEFQILLTEGINIYSYSKGYSLVLVDGVPVRDHEKVIKLDPLLVKQILIYPRQFTMGFYTCEGIVDFRTYKGDMGGIQLGKNVNIIHYKGVQYPVAFTGNTISGNTTYPNYNETIYWNPIVEIQENGCFEFNCLMPQYKGDFRIVMEGLDENGNDFYYTSLFSF